MRATSRSGSDAARITEIRFRTRERTDQGAGNSRGSTEYPRRSEYQFGRRAGIGCRAFSPRSVRGGEVAELDPVISRMLSTSEIMRNRPYRSIRASPVLMVVTVEAGLFISATSA